MRPGVNTLKTETRTCPVRDAEEYTFGRCHNASQGSRVIHRGDDEHAAPEQGPVGEAQDTEDRDDGEFPVPYRQAKRKSSGGYRMMSYRDQGIMKKQLTSGT